MCLTFVKRDYIHLLLYFFQSECIIFILLQRDPMLLLLFLMGRTPHLLVPDDIDPTDYEVSVSVMVFNTTFNNTSDIYRGSQFSWWRKPEYPEKTTNLSHVTDRL